MKDYIKIEGYWNNTSNQYPGYPVPVHSDSEFPQKEIVLRRLRKLESIAKEIGYRGWSTCRCCGVHNGSREFELIGWRWPSGFSHYIEVHNVKPSDKFLRDVLGL